ncbi:MAG: 23S rRNA (guanosine(2251)-2'-O)-methyltransferase RlmB [Calditrichaeota bacterium]|nr:23S rRNA (guanosine(2251)-2'-O)-methyltransferase RlmB [Calditrichota bacterium]
MTKFADKQIIFGRRAVAELLSSGLEVNAMYMITSSRGDSLEKLLDSAAKKSVQIIKVNRYELDRMTDRGIHQGIAARYNTPATLSIKELLCHISPERPQPLLILDGIEDPRNFGAIIRSAEVMGAGGIIFRKRRAVSITPTVVKASSGAALWFPLSSVTNLNHSVNDLKDDGYWVYGLDADAVTNLWDLNMSGKIALVTGSEGKGLSHLMKKNCDKLLRIPQTGKVASLNASVSASIALAEWLRQSMRKM